MLVKKNTALLGIVLLLCGLYGCGTQRKVRMIEGRQLVASLQLPRQNDFLPELKDRKVTVSVGASFYPANTSDSFEKLYKRADTGTYESKTHEGNWFSLTE